MMQNQRTPRSIGRVVDDETMNITLLSRVRVDS